MAQSLSSVQGVEDGSQLSPLALIGAGGLAGMAYWVSCPLPRCRKSMQVLRLLVAQVPVFPFDVVKSRVQIDDVRNPKYAGAIDCLRKVSEACPATALCSSAAAAP